MNRYDVAVVRYQEPFRSVKRAVGLAGGFAPLSPDARVVVKPNIAWWHEGTSFPPYGVIATARVLEDVVAALSEHGFRHITIAEGVIEAERPSKSLMMVAAAGMGLDTLEKRYGVKVADVHKGAFKKVNVAPGLDMSFSTCIAEADYLVNVPVLKTHSNCTVSLGIKNMKGALDMAGRRLCHQSVLDRGPDLDACVATFPGLLPPSFTIIDGIYTLEKGPMILGDAHRSDILVASRDLVSADKVGARLLGYQPQDIRHIDLACRKAGRTSDLSDVNTVGGIDIGTALKPHAWQTEYNKAQDMPLIYEQMGIRGIRIPEPDSTGCSYCGYISLPVFFGIPMALNASKPFDDVEILTGAKLEPTEGHKHTVLVGQCQVKKNSSNPLISHCVPVRGCPPSLKELLEAYRLVGIELPDNTGAWVKTIPDFIGANYAGKPEFDMSFYRVPA